MDEIWLTHMVGKHTHPAYISIYEKKETVHYVNQMELD